MTLLDFLDTVGQEDGFVNFGSTACALGNRYELLCQLSWLEQLGLASVVEDVFQDEPIAIFSEA